jgi:LytS/YehU family sensor histidine kinase
MTGSFRWWVRHRDWLSLPPWALTVRVIAGILLISAISCALVMALSQSLHGSPTAPLMQAFYARLPAAGQLRNQCILLLVAHATWVALYLAFALMRHRHRAQLRQAQMGEALRAAELRLLKSQLNPHFLFNALNGLRSLIAEDTNRARDAVTHLARTLRYTLASSEEDLVTLERELEMVEDYLAIESMRLAERLRIERDIDPATRGARVPVMLLQTLVENAIKHGIAELKEGGTVRIAARVDRAHVALRVENPRPNAPARTPPEGVGLRNATERLRLLFGDRASFQLDLSEPGKAVADLRLPL